MTDCIYLKGIRGYGYIGVLPEEQVLGQWFEVDLELWVDLATAGKSDRIEDTLDYRVVIQRVQHLIQTSRFALLERLATAIAEMILSPAASVIPVRQVRVCLSKLAAPIPDFGGRITIDLTRSANSM